MPSSRAQWIWQIGLISLLLWAGYSYFTASAEARLLADQLDVALDSIEVAVDAHELVKATSDSLIALQDRNEEVTDSIITEAEGAVEEAVTGTDEALAAARNAAADLPIVQAALDLVTEELGLGAAEYGIYEACLGAGWLVGTLLIARFGAGIRTGRLVLAGMLLDGLTYIPFFWISSYGTFLFAIFIHGLSIPLITVGRTTMIQRHYPRERLGRIFALVAITVQGFTALSLFAAGVALQELNAKELYLIAGVCGAACGLIGLSFRALRTSR